MKLPISSTAGTISSSDPRFCRVPQSDSRWYALTAAITEFANVMDSTRAKERVALVTYASAYTSCGGVVSNNTDLNVNLTENMSSIRNEMTRLNSAMWNGATNIDAGLDRGTLALTTGSLFRANSKKTIILLTDGVFTGINPVQSARDAAAAGITVHTVTFSAGANQTDMQLVAAAGKGKHYHAPDAATLRNIFRELAAMSVILTD
jgi:hypothetical protein